ncbi:hypothetical protein Efla_006338 [Eimeria flavescens]
MSQKTGGPKKAPPAPRALRTVSKSSSYFSDSGAEVASANKQKPTGESVPRSLSVSSSTSKSESSSADLGTGSSSSRSSYIPIAGRPAPPSGPGSGAALGALYGPHLSVLCLNAYLIPPLVSWNPYLWAPFWSCKRPHERAEQIGRLAAQYDIVCLQEVWGTNLGGLNSMVLPTHSILPETQTGSGLGWVAEIVDPIRLYNRRTGGLWFAWRMAKASFVGMQRHLFDEESRVPFSNQNITVVELDVSQTFPGKRLVLIGTHFSVLGRKPRSRNLEDLKLFCKQLVWKQYLHWLARQLSGTAGASGGPNAPPSFIADTAVLLLGDFNMDPTKCPRDYSKLLTLGGCAELRDLFAKENNPNFLAQYTKLSQEGRVELTRPDGSVKYSGNSLFPWPYKGRVDYIFAVDSVFLKPDEVLALVEQFPPEEVVAPEFEDLDIPILKDGGLVVSFDKITCLGMDIVAQRYGQELSDHWPLSARICLGPPGVKPEALPCPRKEQLIRGASLCIDSSYGAAAKAAKPVASLEEERQLASNQRAGWRQAKAPSSLEPSPEVRLLQQQRAERRRAVAAAAAAAAETAAKELEEQQQQPQSEAQVEEIVEEPSVYFPEEEEESEYDPQEELVEEASQPDPEQEPSRLAGTTSSRGLKGFPVLTDESRGFSDLASDQRKAPEKLCIRLHVFCCCDAVRQGVKKMLPLAAQRAQAALQARQAPQRH